MIVRIVFPTQWYNRDPLFQGLPFARALRVVRGYDVPKKVVRIILSYTGYVRRVVWQEQ